MPRRHGTDWSRFQTWMEDWLPAPSRLQQGGGGRPNGLSLKPWTALKVGQKAQDCPTITLYTPEIAQLVARRHSQPLTEYLCYEDVTWLQPTNIRSVRESGARKIRGDEAAAAELYGTELEVLRFHFSFDPDPELESPKG